ANAFRVVAVGAERRSARGADPLVAALVPLLLLFQALLQRLDQLVPVVERFDLRLLFLGQRLLGYLLQPFFWNAREHRLEQFLRALEVRGERAVEAIEMPLVLDHAGARQEIEILGARLRELRFQRFEQRQELGDRDRHAGLAQLEEERDEHACARLNAPAGGDAGTPAARTGARPARS